MEESSVIDVVGNERRRGVREKDKDKTDESNKERAMNSPRRGYTATMPRISLIVPISAAPNPNDDRIVAFRDALASRGDVEVVLVTENNPGASSPRKIDGLRAIGFVAGERGRVAAVVEGCKRATGSILVALDPARGYAPEDIERVVQPLEHDRADVAIAARHADRGGLRALLTKLCGTTDPRSGLIAVDRSAFDHAETTFRPVGDTFSFELLARLGGRWIDVPLAGGRDSVSSSPWRLEINELRHLKRLADHRFGIVSRLIQFCAVGGSGMIVDLTLYSLFQWLFGQTSLASSVLPPTKVTLALALSRTLAIGIALVWNFALNRRMTFSDARSGSIVRQFIAYVLSNLLGIVISLLISLGLPRKVPFFNAHKLIAAVVGIVFATGISFSMSRWVVFRRKPGDPSPKTDNKALLASVELVPGAES